MKKLALIAVLLLSGCSVYPIYLPHRQELIYVKPKEVKTTIESGPEALYPRLGKGGFWIFYQRGINL